MPDIVGRAAERRQLRSVLDEAADGRGGALVLRGEAGIGKTTLLADAVAAARVRNMRVLTVTGAQAEGQIPYAGLEHLLRPLRPGPIGGDSPYRVAIDVIDRLGELEAPVVLAVEDAHWLDASTLETLTFLCRRIEADPVAVLMAIRDGEDVDRRLAAAGLAELQVDPLSAADAETLLDTAASGLVPTLRARVLDQAAGNPLGIVELGSAAARSGGSALLPSSLPLSTRVERTFGALVADLPPLTREVLLVAALDDGSNLDEILAAVRNLTGADVPAVAIHPAVAARLVVVDEQFEVRFRHPLLRSALRQQAAPADRRRAHAALAAVLSDHPRRRLWHQASSVPGPDEALARDLFDAAVHDGEQQAVAVALAAVSRAVQLSEDAAERGRRQIWACNLAHEQGDAATVIRLLGEVDENTLRPADRARLTWIRDAYTHNAGTEPEQLLTYADLIDVVRRDGDIELAAEALTEIGLRVYHANPPEPVRTRFIEVIQGLALDDDDPRLTQMLLLVAPVEHGAAGVPRLRELTHRMDLAPVRRSNLAMAAFAVGALGTARTLALTSAAALRAQGRIGQLAQALSTAASASAALGDSRAAVPLAAESVALSEETGQPMWALGATLVAGLADALGGELDAARARADVAEQALYAAGRLPMLALVQRVRGVAALAEARADDAIQQLIRIFDPSDAAYFPHYQLLTLGHLAEAAALGGFQEQLRPVLEAMEPVAVRSQSPALRVGLGYARAVTTGDYAAALADDLTGWPFDRARVELTHGASLRRAYRISESRPYLRSAAATFDALGATPWADRARAELRATGESRRKPSDALDRLTPQEQQIARLAAQGLTNRDIGRRLFLSPRTVSTHLYRIYPKIGVRSRTELARMMTSSDAV